ncbi:MAG: bifunctional 4-hydroxy-2-oxoglutarate aldolase/2-dehydro-3-deoxy-phosphogluconate aldolase [Gammaproteobacteria bacterium]|jgi:2-dehydro-3-deoxyphosphogluconate aldolase / (4S)-4-hydroxy-2-oxoglutarate aldolase|nr:bifunctional 4-hydroxy-2-oxoglutarate aldolase/2-dehydro-3-deoxy-phosphogluconate aldolase [Gammaproteobacteria bacterium]MBT6583965.1 bifunctional 4-hydroxy-2-oxoglutarate aldolase/2-dehydro-3-deoxy-phosphogluconate aldolase [Gammaproteobacteria bacterium]MBT6891766.1 bifunctional 4-hydroxy-2-oxoglutarate aldolase/2-dehydro-3-deoxy-phosphogluconate aldolase [Gammaproteobacteria bacterium]
MGSSIREILVGHPVIPVVTIDDEDKIVPVGEALLEAGIGVIEITLRTDASLNAIARVSTSLPELVAGAGTVTNVQAITKAKDAGSRFLVTPGLTENLLKAIAESGLPCLPGISTAGDIMRGQEAGLDTFKFFPAEAAGGIAKLRALAAPFGDARFCPTGGISIDNMTTYLSLDCVFSVGGTWIAPTDLIAAGAWADITRLAKEALAQASGSPTV